MEIDRDTTSDLLVDWLTVVDGPMLAAEVVLLEERLLSLLPSVLGRVCVLLVLEPPSLPPGDDKPVVSGADENVAEEGPVIGPELVLFVEPDSVSLEVFGGKDVSVALVPLTVETVGPVGLETVEERVCPPSV